MPATFTLPGSSAFSEFRLDRLKTSISQADIKIGELSAQYFYLVRSTQALSDLDKNRLHALLDSDATKSGNGLADSSGYCASMWI